MSQAPKRKWDIDIGPDELPKDEENGAVLRELRSKYKRDTGRNPGPIQDMEFDKRLRRMGIR